jgi:hypothetical protein
MFVSLDIFYEIKCDISCYALKHIVIFVKQYNYKYDIIKGLTQIAYNNQTNYS